jgi:hypothetical protein
MVLTHGCLRASTGGRPRTVTASRGRPPVDARRRLCAGFRQCGSFVKMCAVEYVLLLGGACRWCGVAACSARSVAVCDDDDDDVFYLFLQKQKIGAKLHIYLEEGTYHKRLFRGPNTNDMKK